MGDIDIFYVNQDKSRFVNGMATEDDYEVEAEILFINHRLLGSIKGIMTTGLDYSFYLSDESVLQVNAEESPGVLENSTLNVSDWCVEVDIRIVNETGLSSLQRLHMTNIKELKNLAQLRNEKYKRLLNIDNID